jgi:hypothetical protein
MSAGISALVPSLRHSDNQGGVKCLLQFLFLQLNI